MLPSSDQQCFKTPVLLYSRNNRIPHFYVAAGRPPCYYTSAGPHFHYRMHSSNSKRTQLLSLLHYRNSEVIRALTLSQNHKLSLFFALSRYYIFFSLHQIFLRSRTYVLPRSNISEFPSLRIFALLHFRAFTLPSFQNPRLGVSTSRSSSLPAHQRFHFISFYAPDTPRRPSDQHVLCGPYALHCSLRRIHALFTTRAHPLVHASRPCMLSPPCASTHYSRLTTAHALQVLCLRPLVTINANALHTLRPHTLSPPVLSKFRACVCFSCALHVSRLCTFFTSLGRGVSPLLVNVRDLYVSRPRGLTMC